MKNALKCALIADIIQSRVIKNRIDVQTKLKECIKFLNYSFQNEILVEVEISAGDSVQGLFLNGGSAFLYIRMLQMLMYPQKFRASIGYGTLDFETENFSSNELDGEAYRNAKDGLEILRKNKRESIYYFSKRNNNEMLNLFIHSYLRIRQYSGKNAILVLLINEFLNPMSITGNVNYYRWNEFIEKYKFDYINEKKYFDRNFIYINKVNNSYQPIQIRLTDLIDGYIEYSNKREPLILRGIQDDISTILNTSRQNINKYFTNSVREERVLSAQIAIEIYKKEMGIRL